MSFFNEEQKNVGENFELTTEMEPIPSGTRVKAMVEEVKWNEWEGERYISVRWTVLSPDEYKNRKVFQKLKVYNEDSKKADKAKRMLAALDANAGKTIVNVDGEPSDTDLMSSLLNKPMLIQLMIWKTQDGKTGNWVNAVSADKPVEEEIPFDDVIPV